MTTHNESDHNRVAAMDESDADAAQASSIRSLAASRRGFLGRVLRPSVAGMTGLASGAILSQSQEARGDDAPAEIDPGAMLIKLLRRTTFGMTDYELQRSETLGFDGYVYEQLYSTTIDDSVFAQEFNRIAPVPEIGDRTFAQMYEQNREWILKLEQANLTIFRAIYSKRQLYERVVEFWNDHFNLDFNIGYGGFFQAVRDRDATRPNALGSFRDLLTAQCYSPGMLTFLTNVTNSWLHPNENFARELMELHTLGLDAGYTQHDVQEVARCFTGWSAYPHYLPEVGGSFRFDWDLHDGDEKIIFGHQIPAGGGVEDGLRVIEILASHYSTSVHIARKLCKWFLEENPRESLVQEVALKFRRTQGNIREVIRAILTPSNVFAAAPKFKRPFHLVVSAIRALGTYIEDPWFIRAALAECGHAVFEWAPPDGYPDTTRYWSGSQMPRWSYGCTLGENAILGLTSDASRFYVGKTTPTEIADEMNRRFFFGEMPESDRTGLMEFLAYDPGNPEHQRAATGLMLAMQGYQWY